ncbi:16568_t:CDS:2 [Racocetra persica]|uniref:16568_t:CDS:1 n=1 Tax=Racocetra persica TaxID=160502 RepID=A0ACA9S506_9GLOM|nr:16568_t:CDS:2 [Racocetra persica]
MDAIILPIPLSSFVNASIYVPVNNFNITKGDQFNFEIKDLNDTLIFKNGTDAQCITKDDLISFKTPIPELPYNSSEYYVVISIGPNVTDSSALKACAATKEF